MIAAVPLWMLISKGNEKKKFFLYIIDEGLEYNFSCILLACIFLFLGHAIVEV